MSETFHRESAHDGIVIQSGTDRLFERRVIVWVRDEGIDPESDKGHSVMEGNESLKLTEGWQSS
jgi:hypothetical protein